MDYDAQAGGADKRPHRDQYALGQVGRQIAYTLYAYEEACYLLLDY